MRVPGLFILVGIPGCGKSTTARRMLRGAIPVSSDQIRQELGAASYDHSKNGTVFDIFHQRIEEKLRSGIDVIADATSLEEKARYRLYEITQKTGAEVHVILFTNIAEALRRNAARPVDGGPGNEPVPPAVMRDKMIPRYERTINSLPTEPYTTLIRIESIS